MLWEAVQWKEAMEPNFTLIRPEGRALLRGALRTDNSPEPVFCIELTGQSPLYGIWRPKFAANQNDFDVEVDSFGWGSQSNVGNPHPMARNRLSVAQAADVKALVVAMFEDVETKKRVLPLPINARFLGEIKFKDDRILLKN